MATARKALTAEQREAKNAKAREARRVAKASRVQPSAAALEIAASPADATVAGWPAGTETWAASPPVAPQLVERLAAVTALVRPVTAVEASEAALCATTGGNVYPRVKAAWRPSFAAGVLPAVRRMLSVLWMGW